MHYLTLRVCIRRTIMTRNNKAKITKLHKRTFYLQQQIGDSANYELLHKWIVNFLSNFYLT